MSCQKPFVDFEEPPAAHATSSAPSKARSNVSARRGLVASDAFQSGVLDATQSENAPYSIDGQTSTTVPTKRLW